MSDIILENAALRLRFAADTGRLIELVAVETGWRVLDRPGLGLSFRLLLPIPGRRNNPVYGESQPIAALTLDPDGRGLTIVWNGVTSLYGGLHDIAVTE